MDRPRRDSPQHNGITLRGLSQPTSATKSALFGSPVMSALSPECARQRTSADHSDLWVHAARAARCAASGEPEELLPENPEQTTRLLRRRLRLWRRLLLELRLRGRRWTLRLLRLRRPLLRRRRHFWRIGLRADDGRVRGFAI